MVMLPDDLIQYVNRIELQSRKVADSVFSGAYNRRSRAAGWSSPTFARTSPAMTCARSTGT